MFHGQYKTDKYISEFFEPGYVGTCIDVGAARPSRNNNTYYFEQLGWTAYCIEPNKYCLPALRQSRKHVFDFAAGAENKDEAEFTICTLDGGNQEPVTGLRVDERLLKNHLSYNPKLEKVKVKVRTLSSFIEQQGIKIIDFISIDTEGTELDVLKGLDLRKNKPKLLVIENNFEDSNVQDYLADFGYAKKKRVAINDFFVGATV